VATRSGWAVDSPNIILPPFAGPGQSRIEIGPILPPPLDTYQFYSSFVASGGIIFWPDGSLDSYQFIVSVNSGASGAVIYQGSVDGGAVIEHKAGEPAGLAFELDMTAATVAALFRQITHIRQELQIGSTLEAALGNRPPFSIDGWSHGRGYRNANSSNNGTLVTTAAEAVVPAASYDEEPTFEFTAGRLYRLDIQCGVFNSAASNTVARLRVRKGSAAIAGQQLAFWQPSPHSANISSSSVMSFHGTAYVKNNSGATVSTKLTVTIERQSGAANVSLYGDADMPLTLAVEDIGTPGQQVGLSDVAVEIA
jgi:hypothetical protein